MTQPKIHTPQEILSLEENLEDCYVTGTIRGEAHEQTEKAYHFLVRYKVPPEQMISTLGFFLDNLLCCFSFGNVDYEKIYQVKDWIDDNNGKRITIKGHPFLPVKPRMLVVTNFYSGDDITKPLLEEPKEKPYEITFY